jgi:membrane-associated phospholipid phosphatase
MHFVAGHRTTALTRFAEGVMAAGGDRGVLAACLGLGLLAVVTLRAYRAGTAGVLALAAAWVLAPALKALVARPRPDAALALVATDGFAMPSSHAARAAALSVAVAAVAAPLAPGAVRWVAGVALVLGNIVLGILLVYVGAHWVTDVLAGWILGAAVGWAVARALLRLWPPGNAGRRLSAAREPA